MAISSVSLRPDRDTPCDVEPISDLRIMHASSSMARASFTLSS